MHTSRSEPQHSNVWLQQTNKLGKVSTSWWDWASHGSKGTGAKGAAFEIFPVRMMKDWGGEIKYLNYIIDRQTGKQDRWGSL